MINIKEDRAMNHHLMYFSPRQLCWSDWEMGRDALLSHAEEVVMPVFILYIERLHVTSQPRLSAILVHNQILPFTDEMVNCAVVRCL